MKKLACFILVICVSVGMYARGGGKYPSSQYNTSIVKSQKDERRSVRAFASGKRYRAATGHGFHPFRGHGGASRPESGLGI